MQGNFGDERGVHDLRGVAAYGRTEDLLADDRVDLVDICLPTTLHYDSTLAALESGKRGLRLTVVHRHHNFAISGILTIYFGMLKA